VLVQAGLLFTASRAALISISTSTLCDISVQQECQHHVLCLASSPHLFHRGGLFVVVDDSGAFQQESLIFLPVGNWTLHLLEFTVKETECPVSENLLLDQCDFRDNGVVRNCSGTVSTERRAPWVLLTCHPVAQEASFPFGWCGADLGWVRESPQ
uniref:Uncharacterized protein n=1 Tax=Chrysemys picta bellii TaxID=8478 RepID=A0A8C3HPA6_CHRPI